jgi:hypothetical protein
MTQRDLFVDAFDLENVKFEVHESAPADDDSSNAGIVDGKNILARVVGTFFLVDGKSRNGRFYTKKLWQLAIERTNDRIQSGQMLGTIGHSQPLDDAALLQGLASHRVSRLWIDEKNGVGMGEILVLNTPSGRVLNAYLRGGVKFPVSSRGFGGFRNGKRDGAPIIDEESFELETFDFVRVPGVAIALPALVESLDTEAAKVHGELRSVLDCKTDPNNPLCVINTNTTFEEREMSNETTAATISALARQKAQVEDDLTNAYADNEQLRSANEKLEKDNAAHAARIEQLESAEAGLNNYKALGSVEAIQEVFNRFSEMNLRTKELSGVVNEKAELANELAQYQELGSVDDVTKALDIAEKLLTDAETFADEANSIEEQFGDLGTPAEIAAALDLLEAYANTATPEELAEACDLLESYVELGSLSEVEALIARTEQLAESLLEQKQQARIKEIAEDTGAPMDVVGRMLESLDEVETREILGRLAGDTVVDEAAAPKAEKVEDDTDEEECDDDDDDIDGEELEENLDEAPQRSRAGLLTASLMEQFSSVSEDSVELSEEAPTAVRHSTAGLFANFG